MIYLYYIIVFVLAVLVAIIVFKKTKNTLLFFAATVFIFCALWMFPLYYFERASLYFPIRLLHSAAYALNNSIIIFGLGGELKEVRELKSFLVQIKINDVFANAVSVVAALFYFLAPIVTISAVLSIFRERIVFRKYKFYRIIKSEIYVFSELNERSVTLANDIVKTAIEKNNGKKLLIVFCDVFSNNNELSYELRERASEIGALCLKQDITTIACTDRKNDNDKNKTIKYFLIGADEDENLKQTINLIDFYKKLDIVCKNDEENAETNTNEDDAEENRKSIDNIKIYLFSKSSTSELSIHSMLSEGNIVHVIRVDYKRSMIYNYLYEKGADIIECVSAKEEKCFNILILGMGEHGFEMIKSLLWFCQRTGYRLKIDVYDSRENIEEQFYAQCPGIKQYNNSYDFLEFHPKIDFNNNTVFEECNNNHPDTDFVFVSIGDDSDNISLAKKLREVFARNNIENANVKDVMKRPIITTVVENSQIEETLDSNDYNINIIGDFESVYSTKVIINSDMEDIALYVHRQDEEKENITTYNRLDFHKEYNYRSTIAQVIYHLAWKKVVKEGSVWDNFRKELQNTTDDDALPKLLASISQEHDESEYKELYKKFDEKIEEFKDCFSDEKERWNYYVLTEGYEQYTGVNTDYTSLLKSHLHRHPLIMPFDSLSEINTIDKDTKKLKLSDKEGEAKYFSVVYRIILDYKKLKNSK